MGSPGAAMLRIRVAGRSPASRTPEGLRATQVPRIRAEAGFLEWAGQWADWGRSTWVSEAASGPLGSGQGGHLAHTGDRLGQGGRLGIKLGITGGMDETMMRDRGFLSLPITRRQRL